MRDVNDANPIQESPKRSNSALIWLVVLTGVAILVWWLRPSGDNGNSGGNRMQSSNNLRQIGLGLQNFDSANDSLPGRAICDQAGKPLLSWRVSILPYLEEDNTFNQFKLDEPWDSPNNKPLIEKMPKVYHHPKANDIRTSGLTYYKTITGKNTIFDQPVLKDKLWLNPLSTADLAKSPRGTSNLIFCIEAGDPVIWSKPEDWEYDPEQPLPDFKPQWVGGFLALKADGTVISIRKDFKESAMRASIDPKSESKESLDQ